MEAKLQANDWERERSKGTGVYQNRELKRKNMSEFCHVNKKRKKKL